MNNSEEQANTKDRKKLGRLSMRFEKFSKNNETTKKSRNFGELDFYKTTFDESDLENLSRIIKLEDEKNGKLEEFNPEKSFSKFENRRKKKKLLNRRSMSARIQNFNQLQSDILKKEEEERKELFDKEIKVLEDYEGGEEVLGEEYAPSSALKNRLANIERKRKEKSVPLENKNKNFQRGRLSMRIQSYRTKSSIQEFKKELNTLIQ